MAPRKKAAATAPASVEKPVLYKHNGEPSRKVKREVNKIIFAEEKKLGTKVIEAVRTTAKKIVQERQELNPSQEMKQPSIFEGGGRPWRKPFVEWSDELNEDLFILISTGNSMEAIGEMTGMPPLFQQLKWLADKTHPYSDCRARALNNLIPFYEERIKEIGLSTNKSRFRTKTQHVTKDGEVVDVYGYREVDNVERSKLAVQVLQWTLGHMIPKKHGSKPDSSGDKPNEQLEGLFAALKSGPVDAQ